MSWFSGPFYKLNFKSTFSYFKVLAIKYHFTAAIFGFFILMSIVSQLISGIMLSFSLVPEPMLVPIVRDEEDLEDLYVDDFFWVHERGVDLVFLFSYCHLLRKMYINVFYFEQEFAWKSGVFSFMIFQVVTFLGLVLCCTHLSDITLSIACNIMHTFFFFKGKAYWWLFTDKTLNSDTLIRLAYAHYISAFYLFFLGFLHAIDMHYDWKQDFNFDGLDTELLWFDEALAGELSSLVDMFFIVWLIGWILYTEPEALSYEIFMWGDIGLINDVRFFGVAPHWYFRPFMAWLTVCPMHLSGIFGLLLIFFALYHQVTLAGAGDFTIKRTSTVGAFNQSQTIINTRALNMDISLLSQMMFFVFFMALLYTTTFLPAGRYYQRVGGNFGMLFSYFYVMGYLIFFNLRSPRIFENYFNNFTRKGIRLYRL